MNEQTPELAPQEVAPLPVEQEAPQYEQLPEGYELQEQAPIAIPEPVPEIDFSDLLDGYQPLEAPRPEPVAPQYNPEQIAELVAQKLAQQQQVAPEYEEEPSVDAPLTKKEFFDLIQRQQQIEEANKVINHHKQQSLQVQQNYTAKLTSKLQEYGVDINTDADVRSVVDELFIAKKTQLALEKGRIFFDKSGRPLEPVFTVPEMAELVQRHFDVVSKTILKSKPKAAIQQTQNLTPGVNANPGQALPAAPKDAYQQFMEKKAAGKETLGDAIALLNKIPMERKTRRM